MSLRVFGIAILTVAAVSRADECAAGDVDCAAAEDGLSLLQHKAVKRAGQPDMPDPTGMPGMPDPTGMPGMPGMPDPTGMPPTGMPGDGDDGMGTSPTGMPGDGDNDDDDDDDGDSDNMPSLPTCLAGCDGDICELVKDPTKQCGKTCSHEVKKKIEKVCKGPQPPDCVKGCEEDTICGTYQDNNRTCGHQCSKKEKKFIKNVCDSMMGPDNKLLSAIHHPGH